MRSITRHDIRILAALLLIPCAGCSVAGSMQQIRDSRVAFREGEAAAEEGDYDDALTSYIRARNMLQRARDNGCYVFTGQEKFSAIDRAIESLESAAVEDGLVRIGGHYVRGEELSSALTEELRVLFREGKSPAIQWDRVVPEHLAATTTPRGNSFDVHVAVVMKEAGGEETFPQDAWALVRFLLEGGYGYGFTYHSTDAFTKRPWLGKSVAWGGGGNPGPDAHFTGLKDRIQTLTVSVYRGIYRQSQGKSIDKYGFAGLEAVGPYWAGEHYRSYTLSREDAGRLNWAEAGLIPDETLHRLLRVSGTAPAGL
ncbi:MAG: hypothetical protein NT045_01275 [Candidatus Aureabacteria bacterium]|nr:hypothetical protein [Candidatus Auribacterota bacterium]